MRDVIFTSSVLILAILAIRALVKGKVPAKLQYALWLLAALRLMVPGTLGSSSISVLHLLQIPVATESDSVSSLDADTDVNVGLMNVGSTVADNSFMLSLMTVVRGIWILGIVITGSCMLWYQIRFMRYLSAGRKPMQGGNVQYHGLKVYTVKGLPSPCLCGNKIYLDEELAEDESKLKHILAHEYCHYRQLDSLWAVVRCILVSVYWFHPLVWAAAYASKQDSELACDEAAIALLGEEERYAYGRTLLSLVCEKVPKGTTVGPLLTMGGSEKGTRERIGRIAKRPRTLILVGGLVLVFAAVIGVITFTGTRQDETSGTESQGIGLMVLDADTGAILLYEELPYEDFTDRINDAEAWEEEKDRILEEVQRKQTEIEKQQAEIEKQEEALRSQIEEMKQLQAEVEAQQKALEEEIRKRAEEALAPQGTEPIEE